MKREFQRPHFAQTSIRIVCYLLVLLPAALGFLYVHWFGVNVIYGDSLSMANPFAKLSSGTLGISDLLRMHNQHWVLFPQIAMLVLGTLTQWNSVAEMYLTQACMLGTLILLLLAFRDGIKSRSAFFPLLMIPISLLVFSLAQYENMLKGYQVTFAFAQMFGVLALFLLYILRHERLRRVIFAMALGSAVVASFSVAAGLTVWPAGLLQLIITPMQRLMKRVFIGVWSLATLVIWIAYLIARADQGRDTGSMLSALAHPLVGTEYFLRLLGSPLFGSRLAFAAGLFLLCLALVSLLVVYKDGRGLSEYSFWLALLFWSFLTLASIVAGRFAFEVGLGLAPRYMPFSILAIVSIYGLLATTTLGRGLSIRRPSIGALLLILVSGVVLISAVVSYPNGIKMGIAEKESREKAAMVLSTYRSRSDKVLEKHFGKPGDRIRATAVVMERLGYNVFSEPSNRRGREAR